MFVTGRRNTQEKEGHVRRTDTSATGNKTGPANKNPSKKGQTYKKKKKRTKTKRPEKIGMGNERPKYQKKGKKPNVS